MTIKKYQWAIVEIDEEPYLTFCGATCEYLDEQGIKFIMFYSDCPPPSFPSLRVHTDVRGVQFLAVVDRDPFRTIGEEEVIFKKKEG
jgi:hypothetical protein